MSYLRPPAAGQPQPAAQQPQQPAAGGNQLPALLAELHALGTLACFRHFDPYLRGREELLLRVSNDGRPQHTMAHSNVASVVEPSEAQNLSYRTRQAIKASESLRNPLDHPPASPCDRELERDDSRTTFLVAGYARYGKPFVWLRSTDPAVLARLAHVRPPPDTPSTPGTADVPLKLDSTARWAAGEDVHASDIVAELVGVAVLPPPANPFAVDHGFLDALPLEESVLLSGALAEFLAGVWGRGGPLAEKVWPDLQELLHRHTKELCELEKGKH
ncbi:hypothetical protein DFJ74DRAFT_707158 [Hyaloraphidium curvatum]|nr:hypothetical protein DFJ74DRAFT_707158 [Hyaloraphidium curvatum]